MLSCSWWAKHAINREAAARSGLALPGAQGELVKAVAATGTPCVVVLVGGRPLTIGSWASQVQSIVMAWHPGGEAGRALADVLTGAVAPGGKLPVTFPCSVGVEGRPIFPFGHGLSCTTFELSEPRLSRQQVAITELEGGETVVDTVCVRNVGERQGDEVVLLSVRDAVASIAQPVRGLRGLHRVRLAAGEQREVPSL
ncbi:glycoside hydrolase family 3 C-terminal domain-containing protein [Streptomyces sp. NPDC047829]|uniref:glycoside hydrolase family 3 C-terminal domain-containing protein n=1 Tax=Streptomyces sp. NPDC047829 TaxID=3154609 RepID=UPI0033CEDCEB